jgi:hypothetical protein
MAWAVGLMALRWFHRAFQSGGDSERGTLIFWDGLAESALQR